jgi:hypothetical protein
VFVSSQASDDFLIHLAVAHTDFLCAFAFDRLTDRPEVADVWTSVSTSISRDPRPSRCRNQGGCSAAKRQWTSMPGLTSPLLERGPEIGALDAALTRALSGSGVVLMVEGPAGIGKTAILEEARRRAAIQGFRIRSPTGE